MSDSIRLQDSDANYQRWLDRLVDGELKRQEQQQLLVALEAEPDGWRRCALAFIEAQTWRRECNAMVGESAFGTAQSSGMVTTRRQTIHRFPAAIRWLTIAASLLLAFLLGVGARGLGREPPKEPVAGQNTRPADSEEMRVASATNAIAGQDTATSSTPWQALKVTIPSVDGRTDQTVEVPLVEGNEGELQSILAERKPVLSDLELQTFQSTGYQVQQHRAYYPVKLDDGRQAVLPMDYVEMRYTGGWQ